MIFITVGSRKYPFDRLFKKIDELCDKGIIKDEIFAQIGTSTYQPQNYYFKNYISQQEFEACINKADVVITHGASGSIMKALNADKKVITVTRLKKYGEHINDHQIQNNEAFSKNNYVLDAGLELQNLEYCLQEINNPKNKLKKWENKDPFSIQNMIDEFIQKDWFETEVT